MLFLGVHGSPANHQQCEQYWGQWRCLCANDSPSFAGSSLSWSGTGLGETTACSLDISNQIFGCPRNLSFKRLLMQYGKHPSGTFSLEECAQGKKDSYVFNETEPGSASRGFRDAPRTYVNNDGFDPKEEFLLWPWLKNNSFDGNGTGLEIDEYDLATDPTQYLPNQYLNGVPHKNDVLPTTLGFGEPCAGGGLGDPEQNGICLRMQGRAPNEANEVCCSDDLDFCENGRVGC